MKIGFFYIGRGKGKGKEVILKIPADILGNIIYLTAVTLSKNCVSTPEIDEKIDVKKLFQEDFYELFKERAKFLFGIVESEHIFEKNLLPLSGTIRRAVCQALEDFQRWEINYLSFMEQEKPKNEPVWTKYDFYFRLPIIAETQKMIRDAEKKPVRKSNYNNSYRLTPEKSLVVLYNNVCLATNIYFSLVPFILPKFMPN